MTKEIPKETIQVFAKSIHGEAQRYGFEQVDTLRLINELMDLSTTGGSHIGEDPAVTADEISSFDVSSFPISSRRLRIRLAIPEQDEALLNEWVLDQYGRYFLLSCASAQSSDVYRLLRNSSNQVGVIEYQDRPIGAVAFLDIDTAQRRAELRKLIGVGQARGQGLAEEATRLWVEYGGAKLGLEKIYVSTLQTHLRNIQLNESVGFRVEGLLREDVLISGKRYDVLRMGLNYVPKSEDR